VKDCHSLVKGYTKKNFVLRWLLALKFEGDFDSLDARMDKAMKLFDFDMLCQGRNFIEDNAPSTCSRKLLPVFYA
jgi:hypothetical protein